MKLFKKVCRFLHLPVSWYAPPEIPIVHIIHMMTCEGFSIVDANKMTIEEFRWYIQYNRRKHLN